MNDKSLPQDNRDETGSFESDIIQESIEPKNDNLFKKIVELKDYFYVYLPFIIVFFSAIITCANYEYYSGYNSCFKIDDLWMDISFNLKDYTVLKYIAGSLLLVIPNMFFIIPYLSRTTIGARIKFAFKYAIFSYVLYFAIVSFLIYLSDMEYSVKTVVIAALDIWIFFDGLLIICVSTRVFGNICDILPKKPRDILSVVNRFVMDIFNINIFCGVLITIICICLIPLSIVYSILKVIVSLVKKIKFLLLNKTTQKIKKNSNLKKDLSKIVTKYDDKFQKKFLDDFVMNGVNIAMFMCGLIVFLAVTLYSFNVTGKTTAMNQKKFTILHNTEKVVAETYCNEFDSKSQIMVVLKEKDGQYLVAVGEIKGDSEKTLTLFLDNKWSIPRENTVVSSQNFNNVRLISDGN